MVERQRDCEAIEAAEPPPGSDSGGRILPEREMSRSDRGLRSPGTCEARSLWDHAKEPPAYAEGSCVVPTGLLTRLYIGLSINKLQGSSKLTGETSVKLFSGPEYFWFPLMATMINIRF